MYAIAINGDQPASGMAIPQHKTSATEAATSEGTRIHRPIRTPNPEAIATSQSIAGLLVKTSPTGVQVRSKTDPGQARERFIHAFSS